MGRPKDCCQFPWGFGVLIKETLDNVMLRLVTLDVTNTILRFRNPPGVQYAAVAKPYGIDVHPSRLQESFKKCFTYHSQKNPNFGAQSTGWQAWWLSVVRDTFQDCGCQADIATLTKVGDDLLNQFSHASSYELLDGVIPLLEKLQKKSVIKGTISNFDGRLEDILTQLGVRHYFDFILTSYGAKCAKPDPKIFEVALKTAGKDFKAQQALHIGDNYLLDFEAAKQCGWNSFLVTDDYREICQQFSMQPDPKVMFRNMNELMAANVI